MTIRIAVPVTQSGQFNQHFGQSPAFRIFDVDDAVGEVRQEWRIEVPAHGGCGAIPALLARESVMKVLAGGMGAGAKANLQRFKIEPVAGASGSADPRQLVLDYVAGRLVLTPEVCHGHHGHGHGHGQGKRHRHQHGQCCHSEPAQPSQPQEAK